MSESSHYWGTIWLSLADRQIEYATLREDVVSGIQITGQNGKQTVVINPFRVGTFERLPRHRIVRPGMDHFIVAPISG